MNSIALISAHRITFGRITSHAAGLISNLFRPRIRRQPNVAATLSDEQRTDLGIENPPFDPVSKFQGYELDLWIAKQSPDALQYHLTRRIDR